MVRLLPSSFPPFQLSNLSRFTGKYVGNRPIRLMKINEKQHGGIRKVNIGHRKAKELDKLAKNKGKPLNGRPTPW